MQLYQLFTHRETARKYNDSTNVLSLHRASQRLLFLFLATILLPGVLLGVYGFRALYFERQLVVQQARERLEESMNAVERRLEQEFDVWRGALDHQNRFARLAAGTDSVVMVASDEGRLRVTPPNALLYSLGESAPISPFSGALNEVELLELRERNNAAAVDGYRRLLGTVSNPERTVVLHHLARTLNKTGRTAEAKATFRRLEQEPAVRIGSLPSTLIAVHALGDWERLYGDLVGGRWELEKANYLYYSESTREHLEEGESKARLEQLERRKLLLTEAAERFLRSPHSFDFTPEGYAVAIWRTEPLRGVLLGKQYLCERVWPDLQRMASAGIRLTGPDGQVLFGDEASERKPLLSRTLPFEPALRLHAWPLSDPGFDARALRERNFYIGMLLMLVCLVGFGSYLMGRILKTELSVAQMKSDFVSTVSHEFRTPLAGVHQLGEMLRDGRVKDDRRRQEYYEMIVKETERLGRLVENVLDFSRIEAGRKQYLLEPFAPSSWLRIVAEDFQAEVQGAGFKIESSIPDCLPDLVGDREALTTAVHNLLDNAVKYSADSRTVWLNAAGSVHGLSISVRDCGVGIAKPHQKRIFEKFYRGDPAHEVKGVGLGLSLVNHIVASHGGKVEFESKEGEGSKFTIHLRNSG